MSDSQELQVAHKIIVENPEFLAGCQFLVKIIHYILFGSHSKNTNWKIKQLLDYKYMIL